MRIEAFVFQGVKCPRCGDTMLTPVVDVGFGLEKGQPVGPSCCENCGEVERGCPSEHCSERCVAWCYCFGVAKMENKQMNNPNLRPPKLPPRKKCPACGQSASLTRKAFFLHDCAGDMKAALEEIEDIVLEANEHVGASSFESSVIRDVLLAASVALVRVREGG